MGGGGLLLRGELLRTGGEGEGVGEVVFGCLLIFLDEFFFYNSCVCVEKKRKG